MNKDKIFIFLIIIFIIGGFILLNGRFATTFLIKGSNNANFLTDLIQKKEPLLVKAVYVTFGTAGSDHMNDIINLVKRTELNAVVIDLKDYTGRIPFKTDSEIIKRAGSEKTYIKDIKGLIKELHQNDIYAIARIAVFEDNYLPRERTDLALKKLVVVFGKIIMAWLG